MKKLLLLLLFTVPLFCAAAGGWQTYNDPYKVFTVKFPAVPATKVIDIPTKAGVLKAHFAEHNATAATDANKKYITSITAVPKNSVRNVEDTYNALLKGVKGSVRNNKATLIDVKRITMNGRPAMEALMTTDNGSTVIHSKTFFIKDYHVGLMVYSLVNKEKNTDAKRFFNSFTLIK